jgi:hypothetical protein|tara:strand:+ start:238 stop:405 length:168 start_codon:yes stop_codon:yes gene_type:complete
MTYSINIKWAASPDGKMTVNMNQAEFFDLWHQMNSLMDADRKAFAKAVWADIAAN